MSRNVELEGPLKYEGYEDKKIYVVWFDCDCGKRMAIHASPDGPFEMRFKTSATNVWKLIIVNGKLSTIPSILFGPHGTSQGCHLYITDEQFKEVTQENVHA